MSRTIPTEELQAMLREAAGEPSPADFEALYQRVRRRRRTWRAGVAIMAAALVGVAVSVPVLLLSGGGSPSRDRLITASAGARDPLGLVGTWRVQAAGEARASTLILGSQLLLFRPCGLLDGTWRADGAGQFVGEVFGGDQRCYLGPQRDSRVPWLAAAVGYRAAGRDRLLLDGAGRVVARLSPTGRPTTHFTDARSLASPPVVTPTLRAALREPAPLPTSLTPATRESVIRRWQPLGLNRLNREAYIQFHANGAWSGSDGCNGAGGRFAVGPAGEFIATSGPSALVGCDNSPAPTWVSRAGRIAIAGRDLLLFGPSGHLLGRLRPASSAGH